MSYQHTNYSCNFGFCFIKLKYLCFLLLSGLEVFSKEIIISYSDSINFLVLPVP